MGIGIQTSPSSDVFQNWQDNLAAIQFNVQVERTQNLNLQA